MKRNKFHHICTLVVSSWRSHLSVRLVSSFFLLFTAIICITLFLFYRKSNQIIRQNHTDYINAQFDQCDINMSRFSEKIDLASRSIAGDARLQETNVYFKGSEVNKLMQARYFFQQSQQIMLDYPEITSVVYVDKGGWSMICSPNENSYMNKDTNTLAWLLDSSLYRQAVSAKRSLVWHSGYSSKQFSTLYISPKNYENLISAARYVNTGVLLINVHEEDVYALFDMMNCYDDESIMLMDLDGKAMFRSQEDSNISSLTEAALQSSASQKLIRFNAGRSQISCYRLSDFPGWLVYEISSDFSPDQAGILRLTILMLVISCSISLVLAKYFVSKALAPLNQLTQAVSKLSCGEFGLKIPERSSDEIGILEKHFNTMSAKIRALFESQHELEQQKRKYEIESLRYQINPHFIYNTLNTIKWMALANNQNNIADCTTALGDFLKPVFRDSGTYCLLSEEEKHIQSYITIMNYRFAGKFDYESRIPAQYGNILVMRFMLQPIIENALTHGFSQSPHGKIILDAAEVGGDLLITVLDDGVGINEKQLNTIQNQLSSPDIHSMEFANGETHIGLSNVNCRIKLQYGDQYGIQIHSKYHEGTEVTLRVPISDSK